MSERWGGALVLENDKYFLQICLIILMPHGTSSLSIRVAQINVVFLMWFLIVCYIFEYDIFHLKKNFISVFLEREITVCDISANPACERFWILLLFCRPSYAQSILQAIWALLRSVTSAVCTSTAVSLLSVSIFLFSPSHSGGLFFEIFYEGSDGYRILHMAIIFCRLPTLTDHF